MKKMYEKPMAFEEAFVADEYVAACYFLACKRGSDGWDGNVAHWDYHAEYGGKKNGLSFSIRKEHGCGDKTANRVITDNGTLFKKVQEHNGEQGWINGTYCGYDDNDFPSKTLSVGDTVYWSTFSGNNDRRWNFTMEPLSKRMLSTQIIHNTKKKYHPNSQTMDFTYIVIS